MANEFKVKKGLIINGSGSTILDIQGSQGQLFSVTDNLSGSLFSVNDISGLPILQVSSDDSVKLGTFNAEAIKVSGSTAIITGSLFGTSSFALTSSFVASSSYALSSSFATTASFALTSSNIQGGDTNYIPIWNTATSLSSSIIYQSAGNVGIGTTAPTTKLHVTGITQIVESGNTAFYGGNYVRVFGDQNYGFRNTGGTYVANISMNGNSYFNGGNVGIGTTTPNAKLDISGSVNISGSGTQIPLQVSSGNTSLLFVSGSGNVGIGKTTPTAKLDINGNTIITGSLAVSASIFQYSNNAAITSGSTANIASFSTSSFTAGFFDFVATSGTNARAGTVFTVWNANNVEYAETSTNDIGNTTNLLLSASISAGAIRLQGTSLSGSWNVKTLTRMI